MADARTDSPPVLLYGILGGEAVEDAALGDTLKEPGVHGAPLTLLPCGSLAALVSPLSDRSALRQPDVDTVMRYKDTIDAAYAACPLIPLRFGTWAETPDDARALVTERTAACEAQLEELAGRVEMGLRLTLDDPVTETEAEVQDTSSGTAYLQARKAQREQTQAPLRRARQHYRDALAPLVADVAVDRHTTEEAVASIAVLVSRSKVDAVQRRVDREVPDAVSVQIVGPWAPFTFASLSL